MSLLSPQLQAFLAVARRGTVQQAAHDLHLTQTGVTQRLKALEHHLQASVFERSRRGMRLTEEGKALLLYCQRVLELEGATLPMIEGHARASGKHVQRITLAGPSSMMRGRIIPACVLLGQQQTQLRFSFQIDDSVEAVKEKLRRGAVHFGVLPQGAIPAELEHKSLSPEAYILAVPWSWRKRGLAEIVKSETMIDFDEQDVITQQYLQGLGLSHLARLERHFANNTDALAAMVVGGLGYSLLARDMARSLLDEKLIASKGEASALVFALCWYRRPVMPSHWEALVNRMC